jgi:hypothetical protein
MSERDRRGLGVGVSAVLLGAACWSVAVACGSDEVRTGFPTDDAGDATTTQPSLDGTFAETDAGGCQPIAPATRVAPAPTRRFQPGSCTTAQLDGYLKECLQSDGNACKTYKAASATCAACIESASEDASWGAIVFYASGRYYDYNYGGCIANVTGDFSATGCGAAQTRFLECRHAACEECLPDGFPIDYAPFYACQNTKATDTICATEVADVRTACATYFAGMPVDACQAAGLPSAGYLRQLMTGWCGGVADAGADGGDAGDGG